MLDALDPQRNGTPLAFAYFISFTIIGSFVLMNLVVAVRSPPPAAPSPPRPPHPCAGVRLLWNGVWVGAFLYVQRVAYLDAQKLSLEFVDAADVAAARWGLELEQLVRFYTT